VSRRLGFKTIWLWSGQSFGGRRNSWSPNELARRSPGRNAPPESVAPQGKLPGRALFWTRGGIPAARVRGSLPPDGIFLRADERAELPAAGMNFDRFPTLSYKPQKPLGKGFSVAGKKTIRLEDYLPYLINRVGAVLVARFSADALASRNLSIDGWRVLAVLSNSGKQRQIDLAGLASIDPSTLSRLVARLVRKGFVTRLRSRTSSREVEVQLTAKGRTAVRKLIPVAIETERWRPAGYRLRKLRWSNVRCKSCTAILRPVRRRKHAQRAEANAHARS
jgi:MarR family transcriptional regulator, organic hydroperoxide resistance regulator